MKRASVLWVLAILVQGCLEKEALFFAPMAAPTGRITVTVRVDGEAVVRVAPAADGVEVLERETERIHDFVARGADGVLAMARHLVA